jgi:hypothetical protein
MLIFMQIALKIHKKTEDKIPVHQALSCTKFAKIEKQAGDRFENWELSP